MDSEAATSVVLVSEQGEICAFNILSSPFSIKICETHRDGMDGMT